MCPGFTCFLPRHNTHSSCPFSESGFVRPVHFVPKGLCFLRHLSHCSPVGRVSERLAVQSMGGRAQAFFSRCTLILLVGVEDPKAALSEAPLDALVQVGKAFIDWWLGWFIRDVFACIPEQVDDVSQVLQISQRHAAASCLRAL